jgi:hypothetical protein
MIKLSTIVLSFFLLPLHGKASEVKYLLYHINKEVHRQYNGIKEKAKRGMFITDHQSIIIAEQADVMLVQNDGKSMLLNKPGTYTFLQIKKLFSTAKSSGVSSGFFSYVFEKFLNSQSNDAQQKVSAAVYRGKSAMLSPPDSSFLFTFPVLLQWKTEQKNIPYRVTIRVNEILLDTVIRIKRFLTVPSKMLQGDEAMLLEWSTIPADRKQPQPPPCLYIIPAKKDKEIIKKQLVYLKTTYSKDRHMLRLMEKDLFERWYELYQLN